MERRPRVCRLVVATLMMSVVLGIGGGDAAPEWRWRGKVAAVTGASSGIGAAIAVELANMGVKVVGMARRVDMIKALGANTNGTIHAVKCDLTQEHDIQDAFKWIKTNLGGVDILINDAGVFYPGGIINGSGDHWRTTLNVNLLGMALATREALNTMRNRGDDGQIININSIYGHKMHEFYMASMYTASKHGVTGLTEAMRLEMLQMKSRIKATSISPGYVTAEDDGVTPSLRHSDIVDAVVYVLTTRAEIAELTVQPVGTSMCTA